MHIKSTVKCNLSKNNWDKAGNPHSSNLNFIACSSSGKLIKFDSPFNNLQISLKQNKNMIIINLSKNFVWKLKKKNLIFLKVKVIKLK